MASNTERRLAALEGASEARRLVVVIRDFHGGGLSEDERAAWTEAHPPRVIGGVLVKRILDDVEEGNLSCCRSRGHAP